MENSGTLLLVLAAALAALIGLRRLLLVPDSPFRRWYAARIAPRVAPWAGKAMTALFVVTVGVWLAIWATAAPEDRDRLQREVRDFIKSMEWGKADGPRAVPQAPPAETKP